jgi:hypothetical protein
MARRKRFGSVRRNPEKMIRAALKDRRGWSRPRTVTVTVKVVREVYPGAAAKGLPLQHKRSAGVYIAHACVAGRGRMTGTFRNPKCGTGGGKTPTHALQEALHHLAGKLK